MNDWFELKKKQMQFERAFDEMVIRECEEYDDSPQAKRIRYELSMERFGTKGTNTKEGRPISKEEALDKAAQEQMREKLQFEQRMEIFRKKW